MLWVQASCCPDSVPTTPMEDEWVRRGWSALASTLEAEGIVTSIHKADGEMWFKACDGEWSSSFKQYPSPVVQRRVLAVGSAELSPTDT